jgi:hypothetical protein
MPSMATVPGATSGRRSAGRVGAAAGVTGVGGGVAG